MTSSVKVSAHCAPTKQVRIVRDDPANTANGKTEVVIQDGETNEQHVYDGVSITVNEEVRPT